jgi:hypothetical protein
LRAPLRDRRLLPWLDASGPARHPSHSALLLLLLHEQQSLLAVAMEPARPAVPSGRFKSRV